jgi:hypothetical protein
MFHNEDSKQLSEVVVTALGTSATPFVGLRHPGNQPISCRRSRQTPNVPQGKASGVNITSASGMPGPDEHQHLQDIT